MPSGQHPNASTRALWLLPLAALLAILPLILRGCSCGHDQVFHIQGWIDAASQLRHGQYPHWSFTSAWNAGEPRFLFYPPLSWLLGAILTLIFPISATPTIFIFIALLASGFTFHKLARHFASPHAALIASALYLANPYMLFNAFERSALAELLAAAWIPLLLLAILRARPTIRGIAIPLALLWLTNAPAAVIGSYTLALLATLRVVLCFCFSGCHPYFSTCHSERCEEPASPAQRVRSSLRLAITYIAGTLLGLALPAFYLVPAAYERRFIQVAMAIIPGMRPQDNFLFVHTADPGHNGVILQVGLLALTLIALTFATLIALLLRTSHQKNSILSTESPCSPHLLASPSAQALPLTLTFLAAVITFLLFPPSTPLWLHVPDLAFLQFPWRLLTLLTPILALALALLLTPRAIPLPQSAQNPATDIWLRTLPTLAAVLLLPLLLGLSTFHLYAQACSPNDLPSTIAQNLATHHGFAPTDEYTPTHADNDILRTDNPGYWLLPQGTNPNTPAPNTTPTASELDPSIDTDDTPVPLAQTLSTPAPHHLNLNLPQPETLILNLRAYPGWSVTGTNPNTASIQHYSQSQRDDGLLALQLPAGPSIIAIAWRRTADQTLGQALSALALIALALTYIKPRTTQLPPSR